MKLVDTAQFANGKEVERFLDNYFRRLGFEITILTPDQERRLKLGDRFFVKHNLGVYVEYKSGIQTFFTGNVFIETVSVDTLNTPGWVFTCKADYIMYAALLNKKILIFIPERLRRCIVELSRQFPTVHTKKQNESYHTHGIIVPLAYAEINLASKVLELS